MKKSISFLFFLIAYFTVINTISAQVEMDSSKYYRKILLNPETDKDLKLAYNYFENRVEVNLKNKDTLAAIRSLRVFAINQFDLGLYYESEISSVKSLELVKSLPENEVTNEIKTGVYNQLGKVYRNIKNKYQAIEYYNQALYYANTRDSISIINNKANVLRDLKKYDLAIKEFEKVIEKSKSLNKQALHFRALDNFYYTQSKINHPNALNGLLSVLEERKEVQDSKGVFSSYRHIALYYIERNNKKEAEKYVDKAYEYAKLLNSDVYLKEALSLTIELNEDPKISEFKRLTDSLEDSNLQKKNTFAAIKFNIDEEKKRTQEAELLKEKEKRSKLIFQTIAIIILLLLIASYFIYKAKYKKGKIEQIYKTETRIAQKVHDEVANGVYHIMTKIQSDSSSNQEVLDDLENIYTKSRDISKENSILEVHENFETVLDDLLISFKSDSINVITRNLNTINWSKISDNKKTAIYRVLQELMTNMKKHSYASFVVLVFKQSNKNVEIEYKDNGVGCIIKKQNGLQNAENRIKTLNGAITFTSQKDKGFNVKITL